MDANARDILAAKLALEDELVRPLHDEAVQYIRAWERSGGSMPAWDRNGYVSRIEVVLLRHAARVALVMRGIRPAKDDTLDAAALSLRHMERLRAGAKRQAAMIIGGIDRDIESAMRLAPLIADTDFLPKGTGFATDSTLETKAGPKVFGVTAGYMARLKQGAVAAIAKLRSKLRSIANINTQSASEETRFELVRDEATASGPLMKRWVCMLDDRVRQPPRSPFDHRAPHGQTVRVEQSYDISGEQLMFPGDTSLGASLGNIINCFPAGTMVSGDVKSGMRHWYDGDLVEITTAHGYKLAGTPNHPVLTPEGWVGLGAIDEGRHVMSRRLGRQVKGVGRSAIDFDGLAALDVDDVEPGIEQVFDALARARVTVRVAGLAVDFHGDVPASDVDVVRADRVLRVGVDAEATEHLPHLILASTDLALGDVAGDSLALKFCDADLGISPRGMGGGSDGSAVLDGRAGHPGEHALAAVARLDAKVSEAIHNVGTRNPDLCGDRLDRLSSMESVGNEHVMRSATLRSRRLVGHTLTSDDTSSLEPQVGGHGRQADALAALLYGKTALVQGDEVVHVRRYRFSGHVYNLESPENAYFANSIIAHNCRCMSYYFVLRPDGTEVPVYQSPSAPTRRYRRSGDRVGPGQRMPWQPTSSVTLNGNTRARVFLQDGTIASLRQQTPSTVVISVGGKQVARAQIAGGRITSITIDPAFVGKDIEGLIARSAAASVR